MLRTGRVKKQCETVGFCLNHSNMGTIWILTFGFYTLFLVLICIRLTRRKSDFDDKENTDVCNRNHLRCYALQ